MKSMILIFAVVVGSMAKPFDGPVTDTPEVAAVKAARLSELVKAGGDVPASYYDSLTPTLSETPEVIAAKKAHFEAYQEALRRAGTTEATQVFAQVPSFTQTGQIAAQNAHFEALRRQEASIVNFGQFPSSSVWKGPEAPLNSEGVVVDTEEVKQERERHFAAFPGNSYIKPSKTQNGQIIENAPLNEDGTVADTSEILARKQDHFNAHKQAINRLKFF